MSKRANPITVIIQSLERPLVLKGDCSCAGALLGLAP